MAQDNFFWGYIHPTRKPITGPTGEPACRHHGPLARRAGYASRDECIRAGFIAYSLPYIDDARIDIVMPDTRDPKALRFVAKFLKRCEYAHLIGCADITGFRGLPVPGETIEETLEEIENRCRPKRSSRRPHTEGSTGGLSTQG